MAESSLDDFFAKKDKSKKKSKSKITPGDILSQQEKELGSKKEKKKKKKDGESTQTSASGAEGQTNKTEDDEWVDFEQETEKDYTGLRIQNLQINKDKSDQEDEGNENENDEECDENGERREGAQGPWNVREGQTTQQQPAPQAAAAPPPVEESKSDTTPARPGKYIPPSMRGGAMSTSSTDSPARPTPRRKKAAPNLSSEEDFPTLGGGPTPAELSELSGSSFNRVQSGGKTMEDPSKAHQSLSLGNKFSALQD